MIDFNCDMCRKKKGCRELCPPMEHYVNGNAKSKEPLFNDLSKRGLESVISENYNEKLAELAEDRELDFDKIVFIPHPVTRWVAAGLYVGVPRDIMASILGISRTTLWRNLKNSKTPV